MLFLYIPPFVFYYSNSHHCTAESMYSVVGWMCPFSIYFSSDTRVVTECNNYLGGTVIERKCSSLLFPLLLDFLLRPKIAIPLSQWHAIFALFGPFNCRIVSCTEYFIFQSDMKNTKSLCYSRVSRSCPQLRTCNLNEK